MNFSDIGLLHDPLLDTSRNTNARVYRIKISVIMASISTVLLIALSLSVTYMVTKKHQPLTSPTTIIKSMASTTATTLSVKADKFMASTTSTTATTLLAKADKSMASIISNTATSFVVKADKSIMSISTNCSDPSWSPEGDVVASGYSYYGLAVDDDFNVYVSSFGQHPIQKWIPGAIEPISLPNTSDALNCLFFHSYTNSLYYFSVALGNPSVYKLVLGTTIPEKVAFGNYQGSARNQLGSCVGLYVSAVGDIFVLDGENSRVLKWSLNATYGIVVAGGGGRGNGPTQMSSPAGFFVDAVNSIIYVADLVNYCVQKYVSGSKKGVTIIDSAVSSIHNSYSPHAVLVDRTGNILLSDGEKITRWASDGTFINIIADSNQESINKAMAMFTPTSRRRFNPIVLAFDKQENLYAIDHENPQVLRFNRSCEAR